MRRLAKAVALGSLGAPVLLAVAWACSQSKDAPTGSERPESANTEKASADASAGGAGQVFSSIQALIRAQGLKVEALLPGGELHAESLSQLPDGAQFIWPLDEKARRLPSTEDFKKQWSTALAAHDGCKPQACHRLAPGETLWSLARRYGVSMAELVRSNDLSDKKLWKLRPGSVLRLPGLSQEDVDVVLLQLPRERPYRVREDEDIWDIASRLEIAVGELLALNQLSQKDAEELRPGRSLWLPRFAGAKAQRREARRRARIRQRAEQLGLHEAEIENRLFRGHTRSRWEALVAKPKPWSGTLAWPVENGHYVRGFGAGAGNYHLAVDIGAEVGSLVRAAARGLVVYSGRGIPGYGHVVIVMHGAGILSLYAHNSARLVQAGELVDRGDVIAEVGSTGRSRGPHLHFELLRKGKLCNPTHLFRPGVKTAHGVAPWSGEGEWKLRQGSPPECHSRRPYPTGQQVQDESAS